MGVLLGVVCAGWAQTNDETLTIPPMKTAVNLDGQAVSITAWGTVSTAASGVFRLAATVDLGSFQDNLTPILAAQLNRSDRCGERMTVEKATIAPAAPGSLLTAHVHYERYACVKALGKQMVKRLVGGDGVVEVLLTPSIGENGIRLAAEVQKVDADGSLGELLRSGTLGDSIRDKIKTSIERAIQKSANLQSALPAQIGSAATIESIRFADGGGGRLWLNVAGQVRLTADELRGVKKTLGR